MSLIVLVRKVVPVSELCKRKHLRPWEKIKTRKNIKDRIIAFNNLIIFPILRVFQKS